MEKLLNEENNWDGICESDKVGGPISKIEMGEVRKAIGDSKEGKASATTEVVTEMLREMDENGVMHEYEGGIEEEKTIIQVEDGVIHKM